MPKVTYIEQSGAVHVHDVGSGMSVMEGAVRNDVRGIDGECGGACACATCHVYVDEAWRERTGEPTPGERDMIEFANGVGPGSRLSCQIKMSDDLDGLVVRMPVSQH